MEDQNIPQGGAEGQDAPQYITIGEEQYTPDEARELVGLGKQTREYEQKSNTKLDRVFPEYTRATQELKELRPLREQVQTYRQQLEEFQRKNQQGNATQGDANQAQNAIAKLKQLGIVTQDDIKDKFISKDELPKYFEQYQTEQTQLQTLNKALEKYESEINGEDGRPKFRRNHVLAYMSAFQIEDPLEAYKQMYPDDLTSWEKQEAEKRKPAPLRTMQANQASKQPSKVKMDKDALRERFANLVDKSS